jgi:uncharacterized protein YcnI
VKVEVQIPADAKLSSVSVRPLPGWTAAVTPTTVTWTGGTVAPGQFQEFEISVGPLPKLDELTFKALQTYDDGDVVRWIEPTPPGGEEPEHPAPVLALTPATGDDHHDAAPTTVAAASDAGDAGDDGDGAVVGAYVLGGVAALLAAAALVVARRRPRGG